MSNTTVYICSGCRCQFTGFWDEPPESMTCPACAGAMRLLRGGGEGTEGPDGFTIHSPTENEILAHLAGAYNSLIKLTPTHPLDTIEFCEAIHRCQSVMALRAVRRASPLEYPVHFPKDNPYDGDDAPVGREPGATLHFPGGDDDGQGA